ncbi:RNA methyltransferase [Peptostreptococcaceae bacterium AGR-M142]
MSIFIESPSNSKFKFIKNLTKKKYRLKEEQFLVEGYRIIKQIFEKNLLQTIIIDASLEQEKIDEIKDNFSEIDKIFLDKKLFSQISDTKNSQGIMGICKMNLDLKMNFDEEFILILDRVQDPGNMGTIIRTADAVGIKTIILLKGCVDPFNEKALRSSMGSICNIKLFNFEEEESLNLLKENDYSIVSTFLKTNNYYNEVNYPNKVALVIGNEANGISDNLITKSDILVKIPIFGEVESLNASIASAIMMYKIKEVK